MSYVEPKYKCDYCGKKFEPKKGERNPFILNPPKELRIIVTIMGECDEVTEEHYCNYNCLKKSTHE